MSRPIDGHDPDSLVRGLDASHTGEVINALQRDAYQMRPEDYKRTILATAARDDKGAGDNLSVDRRTGDIWLNVNDTGQDIRIGNLRQQEITWNQSHQRDDYNDNVGRRPNIYEGQQRPYYDGDSDRDRDRYRNSDNGNRDYNNRDYNNRDYSNRDYNNRGFDDGDRDRVWSEEPPRIYHGGDYYNGRRGGGFLDRHSGQYDVGNLLEDGLRGGISSRVGGGRFLPGAATNVGIGAVLNLFGNAGRNRSYDGY